MGWNGSAIAIPSVEGEGGARHAVDLGDQDPVAVEVAALPSSCGEPDECAAVVRRGRRG